MTIVEFFDDEALDNAVGTMLLRPERTVFLAKDGNVGAFVKTLGKILEKRNITTRLIVETIDVSDIEKTKSKLNEIAEKYPDCDFDIAGGNDIALVAIGEVAKTYNKPMHSVNAVKKSVVAINDKREYRVYDMCFSVDELIALHGGKAGVESREKETYTWERNPRVEEDVEKVWSICKNDPGAWNTAIGALTSYRTDKRQVLSMLWSKLKKEKLVYNDSKAVRYKNDLVKYLLSKQGTALEMYTYMAAKSSGFFDDGQSGVVIDWKGRREVENEIDVLLTRGAVGYFVSCKNGMVDSDELYKLSTVARRFGGKYAKKILVLSHFEPDRSFMNRAEEMGIMVIKNVKHLKKADFANRLTKA